MNEKVKTTNNRYFQNTRSQHIEFLNLIKHCCSRFKHYIKLHDCRSKQGSTYMFKWLAILKYSITGHHKCTNIQVIWLWPVIQQIWLVIHWPVTGCYFELCHENLTKGYTQSSLSFLSGTSPLWLASSLKFEGV